MSNQQNLEKKYSQAARREIRREIANQARVWEKAMKSKPKYMPKFIFNWMRSITINEQFFDKYNVGQGPLV